MRTQLKKFSQSNDFLLLLLELQNYTWLPTSEGVFSHLASGCAASLGPLGY